MKYFTIYKTTNNVNGKVYVGQHKVVSVLKDDGYLGSGHIFLRALAKYGKENFSKEIITIAMSQLEADVLEKYYIEKYDSTNPEKGYNILVGGQGSGRCENQVPWNKGKHTGQISSSCWRKGNIPWNKGKKLGPHTKEWKEKAKGHAPWNKGKKGAQKAWNKGLKFILTQEEYDKRYGNRVYDHEKLSKAHKGQEPWNKGKHLSEETKRKISENHKSPTLGKHWYTNGTDNVLDIQCPAGYKPGKSHKPYNR